MKLLKLAGLSMAAALMASPAFAHPGHDLTDGFSAGFAHPFLGADHLLAMITVGLLAPRYGGRQGLMLPLGFVGGMLAGALLGFTGTGLPGAESLIALSLVLFGGALALRVNLPLQAASGVTFAAGLFHGHAHAVEANGSALTYVGGFVLATVLLHAMGGLAGWRFRHAMPLAGGAVALAGIAMLAG